MLAFAVVSTVWFASGGSRDGSSVATRSVEDSVLAISMRIPADWSFVPADSSGGGAEASNGPIVWTVEGSCRPADREHIDVSVDALADSSDANATASDHHFDQDSGSGLRADAQLPCGASSQRIDFVAGGTWWSAFVRAGPEASSRDLEQVYAALASLEVKSA